MVAGKPACSVGSLCVQLSALGCCVRVRETAEVGAPCLKTMISLSSFPPHVYLTVSVSETVSKIGLEGFS